MMTSDKNTKTFDQWILSQKEPTPKKAWDYQQAIIDEMIQDWTMSVCWGKDRLLEQVNDLRQKLEELDGKENISS